MKRLFLHTIEPRPKRVLVAESFRNLYPDRPDIATKLDYVRRAVANGTPLPENLYRANRTRTPDRLLELEGIMHLHITGSPADKELLFLVQYETHVVFLEISDHAHFADEPPGSVLRALHDRRVREIETAEATRKAVATGDLRARLGLDPKKR